MTAPDHMLRRSESPSIKGGIQTCTPITPLRDHQSVRRRIRFMLSGTELTSRPMPVFLATGNFARTLIFEGYSVGVVFSFIGFGAPKPPIILMN